MAQHTCMFCHEEIDERDGGVCEACAWSLDDNQVDDADDDDEMIAEPVDED